MEKRKEGEGGRSKGKCGRKKKGDSHVSVLLAYNTQTDPTIPIVFFLLSIPQKYLL
jgi:hypothetical protein